MATTTNFGWETPDDTDLVKDGALAMRTLGNSIDASFVDLKGGTTGQVLAKASNTDLDYTWVTQDDANAIQNAIVDAKGDLIAASAADTPARLAVGNNGETLVADSSTSTGLRWQGSTAAGRNFLINGNTDIWQRGTSFSVGTNWLYTCDRFAAVNSAGSSTFAQESSVVPSGSRFCMRITAGATQIPYFAQEIETMNVIPLAGRTVTFSAQVAASTSIPMTMVVGFTTNVDEPVTNPHTDITPISGGTATPTSTTFVTLQGTYAIPSNARSIRVYIAPSSNITSGQIIYIGRMQLEIGSVATPFSRAGGTIAGELAACQRYYNRFTLDGPFDFINSYGYTANTTTAFILIPFPVQMRAGTPILDFAGNLLVKDMTGGSFPITTPFFTANGTSGKNGNINAISSGMTGGRYAQIQGNNDATAYIGFSREL